MFKILTSIILALGTAACVAQTNGAPATTNWSDVVNGAQLAINLTSHVLYTGTNTVLDCWIKNTSVKILTDGYWTTSQNFYVILTNSSGQVYPLTQDPDKTFFISRGTRFIQPAETAAYHIPLSIPADFKPGSYTLLVQRTIVVDSKRGDLFSKILDVQVK